METKMMRWTAGATHLERVRIDFGVNPIFEKLREASLRLYGHVLSAEGDAVRNTGLNFEVPEKGPRRIPKQGWLDTLHQDLKMARLLPDQAFDRESDASISGKRTPQQSGTNGEEEGEEVKHLGL
ncbi:unnamed protein product [Heligmosomoides polygyrus]|uniref:Uncharacterized protein n=1 Tax=Heligmosomoides polygyrus TaxID=6339 RepID=A0A183G1Z6_HELPZ|nr:unnamed protein product [Heligmosomoides polygyrus]